MKIEVLPAVEIQKALEKSRQEIEYSYKKAKYLNEETKSTKKGSQNIDFSNLIISTISNNKMELNLFNKNILRIYSIHNSKYLNKIEQANMLSKLNYKQQKGHDASLKEFWYGAVKNSEMSAKNMIKLFKDIPVLGETKDTPVLEFIVKDKIFDFYLVTTRLCNLLFMSIFFIFL